MAEPPGPQTTILIRTYNEQRHLPRLLDAIDQQTDRNFEVVLVDSGSTDRTLEIADGRVNRILTIDSRNFTFGYALNVGCRAARGDFVAIISAHAIPVNHQWLEALVAPFANSQVAMVYGRHLGAETTKFSEQRDFRRFFPDRPSLRRYGNNANAAIRRSLWQQHPYNEELTGLEDIHWAKTFTQQGHLVVYEPKAAAYHIHEETPEKVYNRFRREAAAAKHMGLAQPPHGTRFFLAFVRSTLADLLAGLRQSSWGLVRDIVDFRYLQWRGSRDGWNQPIDHVRERQALYYSGSNQGVVISGPRRAALKDLPLPALAPGEVLVRVAFVGICSTDLEVFEGRLSYYREGRARYPITPGHEFSGVVAAVGANAASAWGVGDRVVGECVLGCGRCPYCRQGSAAACVQRREVGVMNYPGACARYVVLPAWALHRVPDGLSLKEAVLAEPLAVVLRAIRRADHRANPDSHWSVVGAGPIGNLTAQTLAARGYRVTVHNRSPERLEHLPTHVNAQTGFNGLGQSDVIVEATGARESLERVLHGSRPDATLVLLGFPYGALSYNFEQVVGQEKVIIGSVGGASQDFADALALLPRLHLEPLTRTVLPLKDFGRAWELHRSGQHLKILLQVHEDER